MTLKNAYDDPDARATVERKLKALKQGNKDCSAYHAEFATYATVLNYDNLTKRSFFTEGVNQGLKDALSYQISLPEDFDKFIKICIKLDNNARLWAQSHQPQTTPAAPKQPAPAASASSSTTAGSSAPGPMDLSTNNCTSRKRGPLTEAQCKYRRENGLCLYCGNHRHFATDCPHSKKKKLNAVHTQTLPPLPPHHLLPLLPIRPSSRWQKTNIPWRKQWPSSRCQEATWHHYLESCFSHLGLCLYFLVSCFFFGLVLFCFFVLCFSSSFIILW